MTKLSGALDEALDAADSAGSVEVQGGDSAAHIDVVDKDRLGVRIRSVKVRHSEPVDVVEEAARLTGSIRSLPGQVEPVEVAPKLGGAILRTPAEEMRDGKFFEVGVKPEESEVNQYEVGEGGTRKAADWTMTRDQLGRMLDEL